MDREKIEASIQQLQAQLDGLKKMLSPEPKFHVWDVMFQGRVRSYTVRREGYRPERPFAVARVDVVKGDTEGAKKAAAALAEYYNSLE